MAENSVSSDYLEKRMLFKKTLKVASATALWMVALLGATSAMAQATLPTFSAEALTREAGATAFGVNSGTGGFTANLVVNERLQYYMSTEGRNVYARVSPSGMAFVATDAKRPRLRIDTGERQDDGTMELDGRRARDRQRCLRRCPSVHACWVDNPRGRRRDPADSPHPWR